MTTIACLHLRLANHEASMLLLHVLQLDWQTVRFRAASLLWLESHDETMFLCNCLQTLGSPNPASGGQEWSKKAWCSDFVDKQTMGEARGTVHYKMYSWQVIFFQRLEYLLEPGESYSKTSLKEKSSICFVAMPKTYCNHWTNSGYNIFPVVKICFWGPPAVFVKGIFKGLSWSSLWRRQQVF